MFNHLFMFSSGLWLGEGKIVLNMVEEELFFSTKWTIQEADFMGKIQGSQEVQIQGFPESMHNELSFYDFQGKAFCVEMENQNVGRITGVGFVDEKTIAWEFRNQDVFEGFETYTLLEDGSYAMKGEYISSDQFRTQIEARIWLQSKEIPFPDESQENEEEL